MEFNLTINSLLKEQNMHIMEAQVMDQHSVVVMISIFAINQIQIWEATVILVSHIIYQMDTHMVEMQ